MSSKAHAPVQAVNDLPLYTATYHYLREYDAIFMHINRDRRHTIGQYIYNRICDLFDDIRIAYDIPEQRKEALDRFRSRMCIIGTNVKLLQEVGAISAERYQSLAALEANIDRQSGGWLRKTRGVVDDHQDENLPASQASPYMDANSQ